MLGSMTTNRAPVSATASSSTPTCSGNCNNSPESFTSRGRTKTRPRSARSASSRGRIVSSSSSSPLRTRALAGPAPELPSGIGRPVLRRAQRSKATSDFPRPGSPSRIASLPSGSRPGHSQATARGVSSLTGFARITKRLSSGELSGLRRGRGRPVHRACR